MGGSSPQNSAVKDLLFSKKHSSILSGWNGGKPPLPIKGTTSGNQIEEYNNSILYSSKKLGILKQKLSSSHVFKYVSGAQNAS